MLHHWIRERKFAVLTLTFNLLPLHSKNSRAELMKVLMASLVHPQIYKNIHFKQWSCFYYRVLAPSGVGSL